MGYPGVGVSAQVAVRKVAAGWSWFGREPGPDVHSSTAERSQGLHGRDHQASLPSRSDSDLTVWVMYKPISRSDSGW